MTDTDTTVRTTSFALREIADRDHEVIALEIDERQVTYRELNKLADQLAGRLVRELGEGRHRVAMRMLGTYEMTVGYIAIQRAGMVQVNVDPTAPEDRVATILADAEALLLLSDVAGDAEMALGIPVVHPMEYGEGQPADPVDCERAELIAITYTSGSTGTPKGIMVAGEQIDYLLANEFPWETDGTPRAGAITAGTVGWVGLLISRCLARGGTLVAYEIRRRGLADLERWLTESQIKSLTTVPTVLRFLLASVSPQARFDSLRSVVLNGEASTWDDVTRLRSHLAPEGVIVNMFGLTEASVLSAQMIPSDMPAGEGPLPAGQILPHVEVTICDESGKPVAAGERGEIVVRSRMLSLGYWRRPELTRATFRQLDDGRRELHTGDAGRLSADGTLEHLGRLDHLVKISGNRVELREVELALQHHRDVAAAAAAAHADDTGSNRLVAAVVSTADGHVEAGALRAELARRLPGFMVPDRIVVLDELPQLPGGKVDRGQVAELAMAAEAESHSGAAPASKLEREVAEIWQEVLEVETVRRDDDFFLIGGDSMRAARMVIELDRRLGIDLPLSLLAEAPTLASFTRLLADGQAAWEAIMPIQSHGSRPPLFAIHDGGGNLMFARRLPSHLGPDQPVYGLRCEALDGAPPRQKSIAELAATYVERIRALYPHGPYAFYGVSFGGVVALEMARQLIEDGEEVPLVAMGDSPVPGEHLIPKTPEQRRAARREEAAEMRRVDRARQLAAAASRRAKTVRRRFDAEAREMQAGEREVERLLAAGEPIPVSLRDRYVLREYSRMVPYHTAQAPFPDRVLLLTVSGAPFTSAPEWSALLGERFSHTQVEGTHLDLSREASADVVADVLRDALAQVAVAA